MELKNLLVVSPSLEGVEIIISSRVELVTRWRGELCLRGGGRGVVSLREGVVISRGEMSSVPVSRSLDLILVGVSVPVTILVSLGLILVGVSEVVCSSRSVFRVGVMSGRVDMCPVQVSGSVDLILVGVVEMEGFGGLLGVVWFRRVCVDVVGVSDVIGEVGRAVLLCEIEEPEIGYVVSEEPELVYVVSGEAGDE